MQIVIESELVVYWASVCALTLACIYLLPKLVWWLGEGSAVKIVVPDELRKGKGVAFDLKSHEEKWRVDQSVVKCWDPATLEYLGEINATTPSGVSATIERARKAQREWAKSSFSTRRRLLKTMLKFCVENQMEIAEVACRDSGKTLTDAVFGEILVTCEKLKWLTENAESVLARESRGAGTPVVFTKSVYVEYAPLGVIGAIVPWNYPFHNVMNPVSAALVSGNAIVVKVSEYASWSTKYYGAFLKRALEAVGAPTDLVQFVHGYGATGSALVEGGCDKIIFVGSPQVGKKVMEAASKNLTPVVLELGGKDPFVICDDVNDMDRIVQVALRGVFQSMGQNCAGPERFFVARKVYEEFCEKVQKVATQLKLGSSIKDHTVDCGAVTMGSASKTRLQALVDDAVSKGAIVLAGGKLIEKGSFYPPTVLKNVPMTAKIAQEEIFGPIMCIFVPHDTDDEAVERANDCGFALSSCAFAGSFSRAQNVASRLKAGMCAVNDLEGTTYLSQSLPFGGLGLSGFDRFAGPEGLRGMCSIRSVCVDKLSFLKTSIPAPMQYPSTKGKGHVFAMAVVQLFYSDAITSKITAIIKLIKASI